MTHFILDYALVSLVCLAIVLAFGVNDARLAQKQADEKTIDGLADTAARLTGARDGWRTLATAERERADRIAASMAQQELEVAAEVLAACTVTVLR